MNRNTIFPIAKLPEMKALLDSMEGKYKIRYRGPRKEGFNVDSAGNEYWRTKANAMQDAIKKDATGFVVYGLKKVESSWRPGRFFDNAFPLFPANA